MMLHSYTVWPALGGSILGPVLGGWIRIRMRAGDGRFAECARWCCAADTDAAVVDDGGERA